MSRRVALALGSGGARGFAHIGVIEVLGERGLEIVAVAGSSMGAPRPVLPITRGCGVAQAASDGGRETATSNTGMRPLRGRRQPPPGPRLAPT
ncbi:patatin-like phospholipase family protein [Actinoplanes subtropicus]|uniref:patatin-like phospholipase family protein n=1 Tax=Actinoplanes subtropicus TaxID=543632 RepID=UPI00316AC0FF